MKKIKRIKYLIIGAGPAGLGAGWYLKKKGIAEQAVSGTANPYNFTLDKSAQNIAYLINH